jgi:ring-1,2-phenylacetyl-CoA epoxidase subunit PaaE
MPPEGRFYVPLDPNHRKHYVAFAAGSGITPVLSLIRTTLGREPNSRFTLVYGNRTATSVIFNEALEDLKDRYLARFALYHVFSRDIQAIDLFNGRVDGAKVGRFLDTLIPPRTIGEAFVCGPSSMGDEIKAVLEARGVPPGHIHLERFAAPPAGRSEQKPREKPGAVTQAANVTVIVDGMHYDLDLGEEGISILDAALKAGADLPYACKAGVCCTCRAKLVEGEVRMDANYTLEDAEIKAGFRLTCQSHPVTHKVILDFDQR